MNKGNILLIVQNNTFPFDSRVRKEAKSLQQFGFHVFVISPRYSEELKRVEVIDGITVYRYKSKKSDGSFLGYLNEYCFDLFKIYALSLWLHIQHSLKSVHVANPPDLFWPLAYLLKMFGVKFIYDQHDLAPEMFEIRFGKGFLHKIVLCNEKQTVCAADGIIVTNKAFQQRLVRRWNIPLKKIYVVLNGPLHSFNPKFSSELTTQYAGKKIILYVGLMSKNDNVENIIKVADILVNMRCRTEYTFILLGGGDIEQELKEMVVHYHLQNHVEFKGIVQHDKITEFLYIADVCVAPDMPNGLNEYLTLVKVLEYMKAGKPFVGFELTETINMAGKAGSYAKDVKDFAEKVDYLLQHPDIAKQNGERGKELVNAFYLWEKSEETLFSLYKEINSDS